MCGHMFIAVIIIVYIGNGQQQEFLSVDNKQLMFKSEKVFLSGVNQAWYNYAADFGHENYAVSKPHLVQTLDAIKKNGGNSIRVWLHAGGETTPEFNSSGHVTGLDSNFTRDLLEFTREAERRDVFVTFTLWNCALLSNVSNVYGLLTSEDKLQSYVTNALVPMVTAQKDARALAMWEIINEPEGCIETGVRDPDEPCYSTDTLYFWDSPDWTDMRLPFKHMLRFVAVQSAAIHTVDPKALVTVGSWTYKSVTGQLNRRNMFSDACLTVAGDWEPRSRLDLYQIHCYAELVVFYFPHDPFMVNASVYDFDKPVIIGEFSEKKGGTMTSQQQFTWAYYHGYSGAWSWCALDKDPASDSLEVQEKGMRSLRNKDDQTAGGRVNIDISGRSGIWSTLYSAFTWLIQMI